jgi:hypothetical protein
MGRWVWRVFLGEIIGDMLISGKWQCLCEIITKSFMVDLKFLLILSPPVVDWSDEVLLCKRKGMRPIREQHDELNKIWTMKLIIIIIIIINTLPYLVE